MMSISKSLILAAVAAALIFPSKSLAQCVIDKPAYMLYTDAGVPTSFGAMIGAMAKSDVVFLGEYHNSSVVHWLESVIVESLADSLDNKLTLGMEMFEADTQLKVDEYMNGLIPEERFLAETYLWDNYRTDYAPVVQCAKERGVRLVSTNVPRRYARVVSTDGCEALRKFPEASQQYYSDILERVESIQEPDTFFLKASAMPSLSSRMAVKMPKDKGRSNATQQMSKALRMTHAQALKDAVMAHHIAQNLEGVFIHLNGNYHSDYGRGIVTYLRETNPSLKIVTVSSVYQNSLTELSREHRGKADFYIVLPDDAHKTF